MCPATRYIWSCKHTFIAYAGPKCENSTQAPNGRRFFCASPRDFSIARFFTPCFWCDKDAELEAKKDERKGLMAAAALVGMRGGREAFEASREEGNKRFREGCHGIRDQWIEDEAKRYGEVHASLLVRHGMFRLSESWFLGAEENQDDDTVYVAPRR